MFMKVTLFSKFKDAADYLYDLAAWFSKRCLAKTNMEKKGQGLTNGIPKIGWN